MTSDACVEGGVAALQSGQPIAELALPMLRHRDLTTRMRALILLRQRNDDSRAAFGEVMRLAGEDRIVSVRILAIDVLADHTRRRKTVAPVLLDFARKEEDASLVGACFDALAKIRGINHEAVEVMFARLEKGEEDAREWLAKSGPVGWTEVVKRVQQGRLDAEVARSIFAQIENARVSTGVIKKPRARKCWCSAMRARA